VGGGDAVLVIDDTALLKKGSHSIGVAPQYASSLGKNANCQTLVLLTLARRSAGDGHLARVSSLGKRWGAIGTGGRSGRMSNGADQTADRLGGDRSRAGSLYALRLCAGGCRLRPQRAVPSGAHDTRPCPGSYALCRCKGSRCDESSLSGCQHRVQLIEPRCTQKSGRSAADRQVMVSAKAEATYPFLSTAYL
jgi:hypothetical protein